MSNRYSILAVSGKGVDTERRTAESKTKRRDQVRNILNHSQRCSKIILTFTPNVEKVNREVFALIGDVPQLAPAEPVTQTLAQLVKKERNFKKAVDKWVWHGFNNPAR